jgi:hypothetical protein
MEPSSGNAGVAERRLKCRLGLDRSSVAPRRGSSNSPIRGLKSTATLMLSLRDGSKPDLRPVKQRVHRGATPERRSPSRRVPATLCTMPDRRPALRGGARMPPPANRASAGIDFPCPSGSIARTTRDIRPAIYADLPGILRTPDAVENR